MFVDVDDENKWMILFIGFCYLISINNWYLLYFYSVIKY